MKNLMLIYLLGQALLQLCCVDALQGYDVRNLHKTHKTAIGTSGNTAVKLDGSGKMTTVTPNQQEDESSAKLNAMKNSELKKLARSVGIGNNDLDKADDAPDMKSAIIDLIRKKQQLDQGHDDDDAEDDAEDDADDDAGDEGEGEGEGAGEGEGDGSADAAPVGQCKKWCTKKDKNWIKKCKKDKCSGCAQCANQVAGPAGEDCSNPNIICQSDFASGSLIITQPGYYKVVEDIAFNPNPSKPPLDSTTYRQGDGWFLGFFAAIVVEADDVTIDCQSNGADTKRTIAMDPAFHKRQRFFSLIELASRPFIPGAGPPPLAKASMNPNAEIRVANNFKLKRCKLGLSSHHSIHGNNNNGVKIKDTEMFDFEVAGVAFNNATDVQVLKTDIGPSLAETFPAALSQVIFLDHMLNEIGLADENLGPIFDSTKVTLRGSETSAKDIATKLRKDLNDFLDSGTGDLSTLLGAKTIPDGSAVYGITLHKSAPAVGDFGTHPMEEFLNSTESLKTGTKIKWVKVHDLQLRPEAWIRLLKDGKQANGPGGAVFRATKLKGTSGEYVGNSLSDGQIACAMVLDAAIASGNEAASQRAKDYYAATNIPQEIRTWAASTSASLDLTPKSSGGVFDLKCDGDAMSHHNKGIIGFRLSYQEGPIMGPVGGNWNGMDNGVMMSNFVNKGEGPEDATLCTPVNYAGNDVRGVRLTNCLDVRGVSMDGFVPGNAGKLVNTENHDTVKQ